MDIEVATPAAPFTGVVVELVKSVTTSTGHRYHPGERAGFPPELAQSLIDGGWAIPVLEDPKSPPVVTAAVTGSPKDKMVRPQAPWLNRKSPGAASPTTSS